MFVFSETLKHVARTVVQVDLSDHVVEVVFTLFDENGELNKKSPKTKTFYLTSGIIRSLD